MIGRQIEPVPYMPLPLQQIHQMNPAFYAQDSDSSARSDDSPDAEVVDWLDRCFGSDNIWHEAPPDEAALGLPDTGRPRF
jgi:hypothetical protein